MTVAIAQGTDFRIAAQMPLAIVARFDIRFFFDLQFRI
jgi:hypothetical protein